MDATRFIYIQDTILALSGRDLAEKIGVDPASISGWRSGRRAIPDYIAKALQFHVAEKLKTITFPLSLTELFALSRLAEKRGCTIEALLCSLIRTAITDPADGINDNIVYLPSADTELAKIADDEAEYKTDTTSSSSK